MFDKVGVYKIATSCSVRCLPDNLPSKQSSSSYPFGHFVSIVLRTIARTAALELFSLFVVEQDLSHLCPPLRFRNQVPTFAVRETDVSRHNGGTLSAPLKPLRDDSALKALFASEGFKGGTRGAPIMPRNVSLSDSKCWNGKQKWVKAPTLVMVRK